jgi:mannose-6-phosphate isomerase-like protein (cupin superfamily)
MKILLVFAATLLPAGLLLAADGVASVPHDKMTAALAKGGTVVDASNLKVSGSHRNGPGKVEVHDKETDVIYVIEGTATFVTGGTMVGGKVSSPGQMLGEDVKGGETHHLTKGDVIVVPAGTPHWFKEVPTQISYFVVKVLKP